MAAHKSKKKRLKGSQSRTGAASHVGLTGHRALNAGVKGGTQNKLLRGPGSHRTLLSASNNLVKTYHFIKDEVGYKTLAEHSNKDEKGGMHFSAKEYNEVWQRIIREREEVESSKFHY